MKDIRYSVHFGEPLNQSSQDEYQLYTNICQALLRASGEGPRQVYMYADVSSLYADRADLAALSELHILNVRD
jgi:hypothetical protein